MELRPAILRLEDYSPVARMQFRVALEEMEYSFTHQAACEDCFKVNWETGYCPPCSDMLNFFNKVNEELNRLEQADKV
jgi:hypothetical protein